MAGPRYAMAISQALLSRMSKQHEELPMPTTEQLEAERLAKLRAVVKSHGITALAKQIVAEGRAYSLDEAEIVQLATEDAQRTPCLDSKKPPRQRAKTRITAGVCADAEIEERIGAEWVTGRR